MSDAHDVFAFPASPGQARLWLHHRLAPQDTSYAIPFALRMLGPLDVTALREALAWLSARHEALRTSLSDDAGALEQLIHAQRRVELVLEQVPEHDDAHAREALLQARCLAELARPFDLEHELPLRARLVRVDALDHVLVLTLHHVAADGWSVRVLLRELEHAYAALSAGHAPSLPEPDLQLADYSEWLHGWLSSSEGERAIQGLRELLHEPVDTLELPGEAKQHERESGRTRAGHQLALDLAPHAAAVHALARREALSPFSILLAAFFALLHRDCAARDICIGSPFANRERAELAGVVGYVAETQPLRMHVEPTLRFGQLARAVHRLVVETHARQAVPLERALPARRALPFEVVFGLDAADAPPALPGLDCRPLALDTGTAKFALSLLVELDPEAPARAFLEVDASRMGRVLATRVAARYLQLLSSALREPNTCIAELELLTDETRRELDVLAIGARPPLSHVGVPARILAAPLPDASPALRHRGRTTTRGELLDRGVALAWALQAQGVEPGDRVALLVEPGVELVVAMLALLGTGAAYVPLDPAAPSERWASIVDESRARVVLADRATPELAARGIATLNVHELATPPRVERRFPADARPDDLAYVIYTSGSTGRPKGVCVSHRGITSLLDAADYAPELGPSDRIAQVANVAFDAITFEVWGALVSGATLVVLERERTLDPASLAADLRSEQITVLFLTTALFNLVASLQPAAFAQLRVLLVGGEAFDPRCGRAVQNAGAPSCFANIYGPTETTTFATWHRLPDPLPLAPVPIGRPIVHASTYVLDPLLEPVDLGVAGELYIGGAGVAWGYFAQPKLSAERFVPDPFALELGARMYRTGDRVRRNARGELEFLGRVDHQVKVRGFRIELGEVEAALLGHAGVREAIAGVREDSAGTLALVAYLGIDPAATPTPAELREHLRVRLPEYMIPSAFVLLPELPLGATGKIDRKALAALPLTRETRSHVEPRGEVERVLADIFAELLALDRVSRDDDFFALGGHSLLAARLSLALGERLGRSLPLHVVLTHRSVAELAGWLAAEPASRVASVLPREPHERGPLSFAQQRLWFIHRLAPESSAYHVALVVQLRGVLEREAFARGFAAVIARHEILRTRYDELDGEPQQIVLPQGPCLELVDVDGSELDELALERWAEQPFALERDVPVRARLLRLATEQHVLALVIHHIAIDGWSAAGLLAELGEAYRVELGLAAASRALPLQYLDHALWQRERAARGEFDEQLAWWKAALADAPARLELPFDRPRPSTRSGRGAVEQRRLDAGLRARVRELADSRAATTFMVWLAAFWALLARLGDQHDIVVGTPIAGRDTPGSETAQGCFVNTLALRGRIDLRESFVALLDHARAVCLAAFAHAEPPFDLVVEALRPPRSAGHAPVYQVMLTYTPLDERHDPFAPLQSTPLPLRSSGSAFDVSLAIADELEGARVELEYALDVLDPASAHAMLDALARLLAAALAEPDAPLAGLPLAAPAQPALRVDPPLDVLARIAARVREQPHALALDGRQRLEFGELGERVEALGASMRAQGVEPGELVGVALPRRPELVITLLACLVLGAVYVPLDTHAPAAYLVEQLRGAGIRKVVSDVALAWPDIQRIDPLVAGAWEGAVTWLDTDSQASQRPAYVLFTSGSTGTPRGVCVSRAALAHFCSAALTDYALTPGDRMLQFANLAFDTSLEEILVGLSAGATLILRDELLPSPAELIEQLAAHRIGVLDLPTAYWSELVAHLERDASETLPSSLHTLIVGGSALAPADLARWRAGERRHLRLINTYGPTETTIVATTCDLRELDDPALVPIGEPWPHVCAYLLDAAGELVPEGLAGELYLGGEALALGYLGRPAETARRFLPDPFAQRPGARMYRTGDRACRRAGLGLVFLGRVDDQIKLRGFRVEPRQVELAFARLPGVERCAVIPREVGGELRLVAYYTATNEAPVPTERLAAWLPGYMLPARCERLVSLPLTPRGKPDRDALLAQPLEHADEAQVQGELAAELAPLLELFAELLACPVGPDDDFFALGGHSLLALRLLARIERAHAIRIPPAELLRAPTPRRLAARMHELGGRPHALEQPTMLASGRAPALVLLHPVGGQLLCYRSLLACLPTGRLCLGFASDPHAAWRDLPELAAHYVAALRERVPDTPRVLLGWSMGGVIAYEMARQLRALGEPVAGLLLIDAMPFVAGEAGDEDDARLDAEALERARAEGIALDELDPRERETLLLGHRRNHRALVDYRAPASDESIVLLAASDNPGLAPDQLAERWRALAAGVVVRNFAGTHDSLLLPPTVSALARTLGEFMPPLEDPP